MSDESKKIKFTFTPKEFIMEGKIFNLVTKLNDREISVVSHVEKGDDEIYRLIIKGNYERGSTATIEIGNQNSTVEKMHTIAVASMQEIIPIMVTKDYPDSLKKVAEDKAKGRGGRKKTKRRKKKTRRKRKKRKQNGEEKGNVEQERINYIFLSMENNIKINLGRRQ